MQKIREAEFKADNILKQSEEDARDIVEDAGKKAVSMKHEAAVSDRQRMDETAIVFSFFHDHLILFLISISKYICFDEKSLISYFPKEKGRKPDQFSAFSLLFLILAI